MVSRSHRRMNPGISLNVFVGSPQLLRQFPDGPCLIIDADQHRLDQFRLQHPLEQHPFAIELLQGVVATENVDGLTWHRFNDARFNGPWPLSEWVALAPNLSEIDQCALQPRSLAMFLDQSGLLGNQALPIRLWLRQGNPNEIFNSAGPYLQRLESLLLRYPGLPEEQQIALEDALSQEGLALSDVDDNAWIRPCLRLSEIKPPGVINVLNNLFDRDAYLQIKPGLLGQSDEVLFEHWLNQAKIADVTNLMKKVWMSQSLGMPGVDPDDLVKALGTLFDHHAYRRLKPELIDRSEQELLLDWIRQPNLGELSHEIKQIRQTMPRQIDQIADDDVVIQALSSLFPCSFYRAVRPDLAQMTDLELIRHYCSIGRSEGVELAEGVLMNHALEALTKVFPYAMYRQQCPDLADLDDRSLIEHYCRSGMHQTVDLSEQVVVQQAQSFPASEYEQLRVRVKELEQLLAASTARISELQQTLQASLSESVGE